MDGKTLSRDMATLLLENPDTSGFLDSRGTYSFLWRASMEMARRLQYPRAESTVTTVADQQDQYLLNADFLSLYMRDAKDQFFVRYYNGTSYTNISMKDEQEIFEDHNTTSQATPGGFAVTDYRVAISNVTGTATGNGEASAGSCTLADTAASFSSTVNAGDTIHNPTDGSTGYVLSVTSGTALVTALFGGTNNDWSTNDAYVIVPQRRYQLLLDAPAKTAGHTITVPYIQRPAPVFSHYGSYPFPIDLTNALVHYAAFLYKYRDSAPDFGDKWFGLYDREVRRSATQLRSSLGRRRLQVIMKV